MLLVSSVVIHMARHAFVKPSQRCAYPFGFVYTICDVKYFEYAYIFQQRLYLSRGYPFFLSTISQCDHLLRLVRVLPRSAIAPPEHGHPPLRIRVELPKEPGKQAPALEISLKGRRAVGANYTSNTQIERVVLKKTTAGMKRELNCRTTDGHL